MAEVRLAKSALKDLESIYTYIAEDSALYAEKVVNKIYARFKILETHIHVGKVVAELKDNTIREMLEPPYRIIYKVVNDHNAVIVRIYHNARLLKKL